MLQNLELIFFVILRIFDLERHGQTFVKIQLFMVGHFQVDKSCAQKLVYLNSTSFPGERG